MYDIPPGRCQCGCGQRTRIATNNRTSRNERTGEPVAFIRGHNIGRHGVCRTKEPALVVRYATPAEVEEYAERFMR